MTDALAQTNKVFYDDTGMDACRVQGIVSRELHGCDEGELYLQRTVEESFSVGKRRLSASFELSQGFGIRYTSGESVAFRPNENLTEETVLKEARTVRAIRGQSGGTIYTPATDILLPHPAGLSLYTSDEPLLGYSQQDKIDLLKRIDAYVRDRDPRIRDVRVSLRGEYSLIQIVRPDAPPVADMRPMVSLNVGVDVTQGKRRETAHEGMGGRYTYAQLFNEAVWKPLADEAIRVALTQLQAQDAPSGEMTVVLGSGLPAVMLHEAVGHGLEGDFNRTGASAFSGKIGQQVAARGVTVVDQGNIPDRRGSLNFDDEGTPTAENVLIEDGILKGYMQDRMNARLMGMAPTGNGRRESFMVPPQPRMTNTFMRSGGLCPEEIIASIKKGIYASGFSGGQVDITSGKFVFNMTEAYVVLDGKIQYPVRAATLRGRGPDAMMKISMLGNDSRLDRGVGGCGKGDWVPVGVGQPTLRLDGIVVGGKGGPL